MYVPGGSIDKSGVDPFTRVASKNGGKIHGVTVTKNNLSSLEAYYHTVHYPESLGEDADGNATAAVAFYDHVNDGILTGSKGSYKDSTQTPLDGNFDGVDTFSVESAGYITGVAWTGKGSYGADKRNKMLYILWGNNVLFGITSGYKYYKIKYVNASSYYMALTLYDHFDRMKGQKYVINFPNKMNDTHSLFCMTGSGVGFANLPKVETLTYAFSGTLDQLNIRLNSDIKVINFGDPTQSKTFNYTIYENIDSVFEKQKTMIQLGSAEWKISQKKYNNSTFETDFGVPENWDGNKDFNQISFDFYHSGKLEEGI